MGRFVKTFEEAKEILDGKGIGIQRLVHRVKYGNLFGTLYSIDWWLDEVDDLSIREGDGNGVAYDKNGQYIQSMSPADIEMLKDEVEYILWTRN